MILSLYYFYLLKNQMALFIDTETNGLPDMTGMNWGQYPQYTIIEKYNTARIVQLSYIVTDYDYNQIHLDDFIIKRENFNISNSEFHSITDEISDKEGVDFNIAIEKFYENLKNIDFIIAHNIAFDISVIKSELYRRGRFDILSEIDKKNIICTMRHTKNILKIINKFGKYKYPSMKELYSYCFGQEISNPHNSMYDVINLHACIKYMHDYGILNSK
jgi:DNA polymerase III epsilon subunit-like protein